MNGDELEQIAQHLRNAGIAFERGVPAGSFVTYRTGGPFALLVTPRSNEELRLVASWLAETSLPRLVLGRGSNMLIADNGFGGVAIQLAGEAFDFVTIESSEVTAGGATPLPVLARRSVGASRQGLEFYVGIPGTVGGAIRMNAGGHGQETAHVVQSVSVVSLRSGKAKRFRADELDFGYRSCNLTEDDVVTSATFAVLPGDAEIGAAKLEEIVKWRREHQPGGANAGSVFRNPPGDSAGRLIEASGCKGLRIGGAWISEKHANFIQADEDALAGDIIAVAEVARARVLDRFGILLEWELQRVGFDAC